MAKMLPLQEAITDSNRYEGVLLAFPIFLRNCDCQNFFMPKPFFPLFYYFCGMITTIIFDMDGVIIDSEPVHQKLEIEMFDDLGLQISDEEHKDYVGTSSVDMWTLISKRHTLKKTPQELLIYGREKYWEALDNGRVPLVQGAVALVAKLHQGDYVIQVASSATRPTVDRVLEHFKLESFFLYRIGGNEVSFSKPDPEIFIKAANQSNSPPRCCLVIEDSTNGVRAAKAAGMYCIGYANPGTGNQDLSQADLIVTSLSDIHVETIRRFV
jgi:HAD superfamily hydrolase (TIGR01509 family)